jgi:opacity protein-like surface antigen
VYLRPVPRLVALLVAAWAALGPLRAEAERRQWLLAMTPGYSLVYVDGRSPSGGGGGFEVGYGLTEALSLRASGFLSWHAAEQTKTSPGGTIGAFSAMVGLNYTLDVIRLVPYFDVGIGLLGVRGDAGFHDSAVSNLVVPSSTAFGIELGFGIDYLLTRHVALGALVRYHAFLTDITRIPVYLYVGPRVSFRFGG